MTKRPATTRDAKAGFTLGREGFAKISAVEGIRLSADMEKRFRDFDRQGLSAGDRRETIARAFTKGRLAKRRMYEAHADPYCYPGTAVLKNIPGLRTQEDLDRFEVAATTQRADEPLPTGRLSVSNYYAIHWHLFQDVFAWAGRPRTVRLAKVGSAFCYPEHIAREMRSVFADLKAARGQSGLSPRAFAEQAAAFLATLNAIHPFREGNGRTQLTFLALLSDRAGHPLDLDRLEPEQFLTAMVVSFGGDTTDLAAHIKRLVD